MRRLGISTILACAAIGLAIVLARGDDDRTYRVAAVFDRASSIVPGQQVKIAGVVEGSVEDVELAPGPKARIVMNVNNRFAPFHADATCTILPEGLLSENFVACDPGSEQKPQLASVSGTPTVPVTKTSVPTSLQDVLDVFALPTDERLRLLINQLGLGTFGRGDDLNALIRRSNPALTQARRVLDILATQRRQLAIGIQQTNRVLASMRSTDVRELVTRAASVARTTAEQRGPLSAAVRDLPPMLAAARPALRSLDDAMANGTPLLRKLRAAAPRLDHLTRRVPAFVGAGLPALDSVASVARAGRSALPAVKPVVHDLRKAADRAPLLSANLNRFLLDLRDQGGIEGLLSVFYAIAAELAAYDDTSHMAALALKPIPRCLANGNAPACSGKYDSPGHGTIPANDPSCGPQDGAIWQPLTNCREQPASTRRRAAHRGRRGPVGRHLSLPAQRPGTTAPGERHAAHRGRRGPVGRQLSLPAQRPGTTSDGQTPPVGAAAPAPDIEALLDYLLGS